MTPDGLPFQSKDVFGGGGLIFYRFAHTVAAVSIQR
jgi:hypothetical protein